MVSWTVSVVSMASRKTRLAFWTVSRVSVLRVRFGILQAWHGWMDPVKVPEFQIDPLPKTSLDTSRRIEEDLTLRRSVELLPERHSEIRVGAAVCTPAIAFIEGVMGQ